MRRGQNGDLRLYDENPLVANAIAFRSDQEPRREHLAAQIQKAERDVDSIAIDGSVEEADEDGQSFVKPGDASVRLLHWRVRWAWDRCPWL